MSAPPTALADAPPALRRRRRQVAVPQAAIARAVRVAQDTGPTWRVIIRDNAVELFQGDAPAAATPVPRGIGIIP